MFKTRGRVIVTSGATSHSIIRTSRCIGNRLSIMAKKYYHKNHSKRATVNAHNNEGGNNRASKSTTSKKRSYKPQPVYQVIRKARNLQFRQLVQSGESKAACLKAVVAQCGEIYPDSLRFEVDFRAERERLTDSKRFCRECEAKGLVPENVADHIVFEGKAVVETVLKEGLQVLGDKVQMFNCHLWQDTQKLFNNSASQPKGLIESKEDEDE